MNGHQCTREVSLLSDSGAPDVRVNYYDFRSKRLIPSTDVRVDGVLVYRTNALGCRGEDLAPGEPVLAVFGGDRVHGGAWIDRIALPCRVLNAGIEDLTDGEAAARAAELAALTPLAAAVLVLETPPPDEGACEALLAPIAGPALTAVLLPGGEAAQALQTWCDRRGWPVLRPRPPRTSLMRRLTGREAPHDIDSALARAVETLAAPLADSLAAQTGPAPTEATLGATVAEGAKDVGRNYPLW